MALKNSLLSELDAVLFLKFFNHVFEESKLVLFLNYLGVHFNVYFFFDSSFVESISRNLSEEFKSFGATSLETLLIEFLAILNLPVFTSLGI